MRTLAANPVDHNIFLSGSYDHYAKFEFLSPFLRIIYIYTYTHKFIQFKKKIIFIFRFCLIRLWDTRQENEIFRFEHDHPVDSSCMASSGALAFTSAGNEIKIWDIVSGGKLLHTFKRYIYFFIFYFLFIF